jgi:GT2 family glycosyltransferase
MKDLSVLIVSYNTKELLLQTITTLRSCLTKTPDVSYEIIVADNGSEDGSLEALSEFRMKNLELRIIENKRNLGFAAANNIAEKQASGKYVLLLNSDTIVDNVNFKKLIDLMDNRTDIGVLTVKLVMPDGEIDPASHRGFPTLWRSLAYFSKAEKVTSHVPGLNRMFGGYHLTYLNLNSEHEIDSPSGAFFLTRKELYDKVGGLDESFFMYGEDIDLAWRIKEAGHKIWYYPQQSIIHVKGQSGRKTEDSKKKSATDKYFYDAMKIFYKKHYEKRYPSPVNKLVLKIIDSKI